MLCGVMKASVVGLMWLYVAIVVGCIAEDSLMG